MKSEEKRMLFAEILSDYFDYIKCYSESTQKVYRPKLIHFLKHGAPEYVQDITNKHINQYKSSLLKSGKKNQTVNTYLAAINSFYRWFYDTYEFEDIPNKITYLIGESIERRVLTKTEYEIVLIFNSGINKDVVQLLANTGLRSSEFLNLKATDYEGDYLYIRKDKGSIGRRIPLNKTTKSILNRYINHTENIINFIKSTQAYNKWLLRLCYRSARIAHIENFSPRNLRHFFACQLNNKGVPIETISSLLGLKHVISSEIYHQASERNLKGLTDCLDK